MLEEWLRSYRPQELFDERGRLKPELKALAPKGERRMGANPVGERRHAAARPAACRISRTTRSTSPSPGIGGIGATHVLGRYLRDVVDDERRADEISGYSGRMRPLSNGLEAVFEATRRQWEAATIPDDEFLAPDGPGDGDAERASMRGMARGLSAHRPARPVQLLRGLHSHRRFDVQSACEVAEGHRRASLAPQDRLAQLPAELACLAAGSQRLHSSGSGIHRSRDQQEGGGRARLSAARLELPAVGDGSLPAQPPLRQRRGGGQASRAAVAVDGCGPQALHRGGRHLAMGEQRPAGRARPRHGLRRRRADARDAGRGVDPARASCRRSRSAWSTWSTS